MTKDHSQKQNANLQLTDDEQKLIEQLRKHPEIQQRVESILAITTNQGGVKKADEVEGLLLDEMRRLGHTSMACWAAGTEKQLAQELKQKDDSVLLRKKKL